MVVILATQAIETHTMTDLLVVMSAAEAVVVVLHARMAIQGEEGLIQVIDTILAIMVLILTPTAITPILRLLEIILHHIIQTIGHIVRHTTEIQIIRHSTAHGHRLIAMIDTVIEDLLIEAIVPTMTNQGRLVTTEAIDVTIRLPMALPRAIAALIILWTSIDALLLLTITIQNTAIHHKEEIKIVFPIPRLITLPISITHHHHLDTQTIILNLSQCRHQALIQSIHSYFPCRVRQRSPWKATLLKIYRHLWAYLRCQY